MFYFCLNLVTQWLLEGLCYVVGRRSELYGVSSLKWECQNEWSALKLLCIPNHVLAVDGCRYDNQDNEWDGLGTANSALVYFFWILTRKTHPESHKNSLKSETTLATSMEKKSSLAVSVVIAAWFHFVDSPLLWEISWITFLATPSKQYKYNATEMQGSAMQCDAVSFLSFNFLSPFSHKLQF